MYAVALGTPAQCCVLEDAVDGNTAYYRTPDSIHHVPKLPLKTLVIN